MVAIPFELSVGTEIAFDTYQFSLFRNLYLSQQSRQCSRAEFSAKKQKSSYRTILCKWIFPFGKMASGNRLLLIQPNMLWRIVLVCAAPEISIQFGTILS
jgi:hypothetical protein